MGPTELLVVLAPLTWAELDRRWVVFQRANGVVCELDALSGLVLSVLEHAAVSADDVAAQVALAVSGDTTAVARAQVDAAIEALIAAGLVEKLHRTRQACA